jgi:hypothetical protein
MEDEDGTGHTSRSSGLFRLEESRDRVSSLASRLVEAWCLWCTWHHRGGHVELKLKMDGSMQQTASDSSTSTLPFSLY